MSNSMFSQGYVRPRPFRALAVEAESEPEQITETAFFESVAETDTMLEAVNALADTNARQSAAAAVVQWVDGGDADFDELDAIVFGMVADDPDSEEDLNDVQYAEYEKLSDLAAEFIATVSGASAADVEAMGDDEESAERVFNALEAALSDTDTDEAVAEFAVRESLMLEAVKKVIRDGEVKYIKKRTRKRRMTAAQKAALKKARRKANTGAAKAARKKSLRMRKSRGM